MSEPINSTFRNVPSGFQATHRRNDNVVLRNYLLQQQDDEMLFRVETRWMITYGKSDTKGEVVREWDAVYPITDGTVNGSELPPRVWAEQHHFEDPKGDFDEWHEEVNDE